MNTIILSVGEFYALLCILHSALIFSRNLSLSILKKGTLRKERNRIAHNQDGIRMVGVGVSVAGKFCAWDEDACGKFCAEGV